MSTQTLSRSKGRRRLDPSNIPGGTLALPTSTLVTAKWQIDFSNAVQVANLPTDFLVNGQPATGFVQNTPTRITLSYAVAVASGQTWVIPSHSPNIRTQTGGYVASATGTF